VVTTRLVDLEGFVASIRQGLNRAI
jgi:hypothetical protein